MSIQKFFLPSSQLPSPNGPLSSRIPPCVIAAANREVRRVQQVAERKPTRGPYRKYTQSERAEIGKYSLENGISAAQRKFSRKMGVKISLSTIQGIKDAYKKEMSRKRKASEDGDILIKELPGKKRGSPLLLGESIDHVVQQYVLKLRECGGAVNTAVVVAGAHGIVKSMDRTRLVGFGGHADLNVSWAKSLLKRMNFTKRRGTTKSTIPIEAFNRVKKEFLKNIIDVLKMEEIPMELILN